VHLFPVPDADDDHDQVAVFDLVHDAIRAVAESVQWFLPGQLDAAGRAWVFCESQNATGDSSPEILVGKFVEFLGSPGCDAELIDGHVGADP
jgi:hypothetical protein